MDSTREYSSTSAPRPECPRLFGPCLLAVILFVGLLSVPVTIALRDFPNSNRSQEREMAASPADVLGISPFLLSMLAIPFVDLDMANSSNLAFATIQAPSGSDSYHGYSSFNRNPSLAIGHTRSTIFASSDVRARVSDPATLLGNAAQWRHGHDQSAQIIRTTGLEGKFFFDAFRPIVCTEIDIWRIDSPNEAAVNCGEGASSQDHLIAVIEGG